MEIPSNIKAFIADRKDRYGRGPLDPGYGLMTPEDVRMEAAVNQARYAARRSEAERAGQLTPDEQKAIEAAYAANAAAVLRLNVAQDAHHAARMALAGAFREEVQMDRTTRDPILVKSSPATVARLEADVEASRVDLERITVEVKRDRLAALHAEREVMGTAERRQRTVQLRLNTEEAARSRKLQGLPEATPDAPQKPRMAVRYRS